MLSRLQSFEISAQIDALWSMVALTYYLRDSATWESVRRSVEKDCQVDCSTAVVFGLAENDGGLLLQLCTADRRLVEVEFSEFHNRECHVDTFDDQLVLDLDSLEQVLAASLQSDQNMNRWFTDQVQEFAEREREYQNDQGSDFLEQTLINPDDAVTYHQEWLLPRVKRFLTGLDSSDQSHS